MKVNGFTLKKTRNRQYSKESMIDTVYADDLKLLTNAPAQVKSLLDCLEQAIGGIGPYVNANKKCFK